MRARTLDPPLCCGFLSLVCLCWSSGAGVSRASEDQFPTPVAKSLSASFSSVTEGQTLRQVCGSVSRACDVVIYLDRRIDPDQLIAAEIAGPTVSEALSQICLPLGFTWCPVDELVIIGPGADTEQIATEMLVEWHELSSSASAIRGRLTDQNTVSWPRLATPDEVLQQIAQAWQLDVAKIHLPHDHFPETELGEVRVTTALGVLLSGFELGYRIIPESRVVEVFPTAKGPNRKLERTYPDASLSTADRNHILQGHILQGPRELAATGNQTGNDSIGQKIAPNRDDTQRLKPVLKKSSGGWMLSGSAVDHARMEQWLLRQSNHKKEANGKVVGVQKTYSLRLENKPVLAVLQTLCRQGNLELELENPTDKRLETVISLSAEKETLEKLIARVAQAAGLRASLQTSKVVIGSPES